jgi:anthranilate phosphoribosyltransferase
MPMTPQEALQRTIEHREIFHDEMLHLMRMIMKGEVSPVMMAALITGLRVKKETIGEITAAAQVMREFSTKVHVADKTHWWTSWAPGATARTPSTSPPVPCSWPQRRVPRSASTAGAASAASRAVPMCWRALGVNINLSPEAIARCIDEVGIGFMFAPNHHPAMKNVAPVRTRAGHQDHLQHPGAPDQPGVGAQHPDGRVPPRSGGHPGACAAAPGHRACRGGVWARRLDEVSLGAATMVGELRDGEITEYEIHPEDFGLAMASNRALKVETPDQSRALLLDVLDNQHGAARDIVILNAGVALYAANVADTMKDGVERARAAIESGAAKARLEQLVVTAHALSTPA